MALYIVNTSGKDEIWHVGTPNLILTEIINVSFIQVDGHELDHIRQQFTNLPMTTKRSARWFGDLAKFIVANL